MKVIVGVKRVIDYAAKVCRMLIFFALASLGLYFFAVQLEYAFTSILQQLGSYADVDLVAATLTTRGVGLSIGACRSRQSWSGDGECENEHEPFLRNCCRGSCEYSGL